MLFFSMFYLSYEAHGSVNFAMKLTDGRIERDEHVGLLDLLDGGFDANEVSRSAASEYDAVSWPELVTGGECYNFTSGRYAIAELV
jgi:hypothetical protein